MTPSVAAQLKPAPLYKVLTALLTATVVGVMLTAVAASQELASHFNLMGSGGKTAEYIRSLVVPLSLEVIVPVPPVAVTVYHQLQLRNQFRHCMGFNCTTNNNCSRRCNNNGSYSGNTN
jgi:hypothetical protein